ncbi:MAG: hypothetical protein R3B99_02065 [Polyangiales bacterium]
MSNEDWELLWSVVNRLRDRVGEGPDSDDRFYGELSRELTELDPETRERVCRDYVSAAEAARTEDVWLALVTMEGPARQTGSSTSSTGWSRGALPGTARSA